MTQVRIPKGNQITKSACISLSSKAGLSVKSAENHLDSISLAMRWALRLGLCGDR